jgi:hypothetical protein
MLRPVGRREASAFIDALHRHHRPPQGFKFAIGLEEGGKLVGVVTVGRPVARGLDDGFTAEVTRLCTDGTPNACSTLYGAACRAAKAMGYRKIYTYTLATEPGGSLRASGWCADGDVVGRQWDTPTRRREASAPKADKRRWVRVLQDVSQSRKAPITSAPA